LLLLLFELLTGVTLLGQTESTAEYQVLQTRVELNDSLLNRYQFTMWLEARSRAATAAATQEAAVEPSTGQPRPNHGELRKIWRAYLPAYQQYQREIFGLHQIDLATPRTATVEETLDIEFNGTAYAVEVMTWQAAPGIHMPATLYRPLHTEGRRFPVVISPPGCGEDVATHTDYTSVQRRMANLALSGFVAFFTDGFCLNGLFGSIPGNEHYYSYYAGVAGAGVSTATLELATWLRALDYLESRSDTDMSRVGVTGYSNGAGITLNLASVTDRVHALAPVSIALGGQQLDSFVFTNVRNGIFFSRAAYSYFNVHWAATSGYTQETLDALKELTPPLRARLSEQQLSMASRYGAPRPVYALLGVEEGNDLAPRAAVAGLQELWRILGADHTPRIDIVAGEHNFNAQRRGLVNRWLAKVLRAEPLLPFPSDSEYATPILPSEQLRVVPLAGTGQTLREYFAAVAEKQIQDRSPESSGAPGDQEARRDTLRALLGLRNVPSPPREGDPLPRPILVDEFVPPGQTLRVKLQYWLIPVNEHIRTAALILGRPDDFDRGKAPEVEIRITTDSLLPSEAELMSQLEAGKLVVSLMAPGYGPTASGQTTVGDLARHLATSSPLLGMAVGGVRQTATLVEDLWKGAVLHGTATGVDASNVLLFAAALDPNRFKTVRVYDSMGSFRDLFTAPTDPVVPPTLLIPGLLAAADVPDLVELGRPTKVSIESVSDLSEFPPWDRPPAAGPPDKPAPISIAPSSGGGSGQTFTASFSDGRETGSLRYTYVLINSALTWVGSCGLRYDRTTNVVEIIHDDGSGWKGGIAPGSGTLSNSQCSVDGAGFSITTSGNTLTQSFAVDFSAAFKGDRSIFLDASDRAGVVAGWRLAGSWTVP
jgi:dienelactone hydrolase